MKFDYYYGSQADQFTFIRIPKMMITDSSFASLSIAAKMLYGVLLDRMSLSRKNGWLDGENRVFIVYPIAEIQEDLGFSRKKAMEYLGELENFGLVEKRRRGLGLPSILYVKSFLASSDDKGSENPGEDAEPSMALNGTSGSPGFDTSGCCDAIAEPSRPAKDSRRKKDKTRPAGSSRSCSARTGSFQIDTSRSVRSGTSRSSETEPQEVPGSAPLSSNTDCNKTDANNISSHLIRITGDAVPVDPGMGCDSMNAYAEMIAENLQIEDLKRLHPMDSELLDGIYAMVLETVVSTGDTIVIASNSYPAAVVKSRFLHLDAGHIEYVLECFKGITTKVRNIRKYLLAALYNAPTTIDGYYQAEANHDLYGT